MCAPVLLLAATAAAGLVKAGGDYQQGTAQANMYQFQSNAAQMQKTLISNTAKANVSAVQDQAARNSGQLYRQQSEVKGAQQAAAGAQGLAGSTTAADIAKDTFTKTQLDQMTLQYNANVKAWDITNRMNNDIWAQDVNISQYDAARKNVLKARNITLGTDLLSTAASTAAAGLKYNSPTTTTF